MPCITPECLILRYDWKYESKSDCKIEERQKLSIESSTSEVQIKVYCALLYSSSDLSFRAGTYSFKRLVLSKHFRDFFENVYGSAR